MSELRKGVLAGVAQEGGEVVGHPRVEVYFDEELEGTDLAYELIIDNAVVWLPRSCAEITEAGVVEVEEWMAEEKELI